MNTLDNGPAGGDYARYIDDLMRDAAGATGAAAPPGNDIDGASLGGVRQRAVARAAGPAPSPVARTAGAPAARRPDVAGTAARRPGAAPSRDTGFVDPTPASQALAAAAAAATASMSGEILRRGAPGRALLAAFAATVLGGLLVIVGFVWPAASVAVLLVGGALLTWGVRRLRDAIRRTMDGGRGTTTTT